MIPRVVEVKHVEGYRLWLRFHDGVCGTIDLSAELWGPMFEPLKDVALFSQAAVHPECETVVWPNGADLAPEYLYEAAKQSSKATALR
jgi:hypothetical protein